MPYRGAIGSFIYLLIGTHPGISYAVTRLAKSGAIPKLRHRNCIKRVFCYLFETKKLGLEYTQKAKFNRIVYADADWASNTKTRESVSGMVTIMGGTAVPRYF